MKINNSKVNLTLSALFVALTVSGIGMHAGRPEFWHTWAVVHVVTGLAFTVATFYHIAGHSEWFRRFFQIEEESGHCSPCRAVFSWR